MSELRLSFAGTPAFAAAHLTALLEDGRQVACVYTQPDRPAGRGREPQPSPVKRVALAAGLPVFQPASLGDPAGAEPLREARPDLLVVVAYGLLLPRALLEMPRYGCLNVHASLLPRWRGAAPIERALLAGDRESGISIMQLDEGMDTGAMLHRVAVPIAPADDRQTLTARLQAAGIAALRTVLADLPRYQGAAEAQDERLATLAPKLRKEEALIDWRRDASHIDRQVRAGIGRQPAYTHLHGERLRVLRASPASAATPGAASAPPGTVVAVTGDSIAVACGAGALQLDEVQFAGGKPMTVAAALNARPPRFQVGQALGAAAGAAR